MTQVALNAAAGLVAAVLVYVYAVCRMSVLQFGRHKASWVLLHIGLGATSGWVLMHAVQGAVDLQDAAGLLAAGAWVLLSADDFHAGAVPSAAQSRPVPLDTVPMEHVQG